MTPPAGSIIPNGTHALPPSVSEVPSWVQDKLGVPEREIAFLEVSKDQAQLYGVLLDYIYHRGVDVDEDEPLNALEKAPNDANTLEREYPGRLSALSCSSVIPNYKKNKRKSGASDQITTRNFTWKKGLIDTSKPIATSDADIAEIEESKSTTNSSEGEGNTKVAKEKIAASQVDEIKSSEPNGTVENDSDSDSDEVRPPVPAFKFGLGTARLNLDGAAIFIKHELIRAPVSFIPTKMSSLGYRSRYGMMFGGFGSFGDPARSAHSEKDSACYRSLYLYALDPEILKHLCRSALEWDFVRNKPDLDPRSGKYQLFSLAVRGCGTASWECQGWKASRRLDSIILPGGQLDAIVSDFREFSAKETKAWYIAHGLPYRRSYLFYGPPGVGKTSTIRALAGTLEVAACFMSLGDYKIGNGELQDALSSLPPCPSMLVIEDVDALFNETRKNDGPSPLTFSALLNALDGLVSADGVLTVMTTNHLDRLDAALVRAGRVDRRFCFKPPTTEQIKALFLSFYPDAKEKLATNFADAVFARPEKEARSIATLQELFIYTRKKTAEESVELLDHFFTEFYPGGGYDIKNVLYA